MTYKEAAKEIQRWIKGCPYEDTKEAFELGIKALETLDDVKHKVYRNEKCDRAGKCYDYIGYHCAGCNRAKEDGAE